MDPQVCRVQVPEEEVGDIGVVRQRVDARRPAGPVSRCSSIFQRSGRNRWATGGASGPDPVSHGMSERAIATTISNDISLSAVGLFPVCQRCKSGVGGQELSVESSPDV